MRALTLLFTFLISFPFTLSAQIAGDVLQKVSEAMAAEQWEQAVSLFRQAIQLNADKSEMFYWTSVDKNSNVSTKIAQELTLHYKNARNYDKAYLFCKELLQKFPNDVKWLLTCAETEVCRGKEDEALQTYQKVLSLDANNLDANIFVGNYYYLKAEQEKQQLMRDYKKINSPTRMQYARYKDGLSRLMTERYSKAKEYLQNVVRQFPSTEVMKTLEKIRKLEVEMK
ncbi:tetratricopeptide repeat protein [Bacteroides sp.]|uniref:tetratricopeptide repeat protein n=1 Tax=Bacteroides sp. TaxID=29523 RepID=UPI0025C1C6BB|nr:tetratricopeptide repeat protein [Bacteroides sp.]